MPDTLSLPLPAAEGLARQKVRVARISALAATGMVIAKALVGWQTGSLGILSEAAHSTMDLIATLITLFAVRVADRPADSHHHYGHGKVENLSALIETGLLLLTCGWIISEALERLFWKPAAVEVTWIAFAVIVGSILVDLWRSRALARTAAATGSQALEADALHFRTEIYSSSAVLVGLGAVWVSERWQVPWLVKADALSGILVAGIVLVIGSRLGRRAVDALLDHAPLELVERIRAAIASVPEVVEPVSLRTRVSGNRLFVDAAVSVARGTPFETAHQVVSQVEARIREIAPQASVVIHADPFRRSDESLAEAIRVIVSRHAAGAHDIFIHERDGKRCVDLHLEVPGDLSLVEAHAITERIEADLRNEFPRLGPIHTHVDPVKPARPIDAPLVEEMEAVRRRIRLVAAGIPGIQDCTSISVRHGRQGFWVVCRCTMDARLTIREAHELGLELAARARREIPGVDQVTVHAEPGVVQMPSRLP
jgi:cation diffusion facilitator family transporter